MHLVDKPSHGHFFPRLHRLGHRLNPTAGPFRYSPGFSSAERVHVPREPLTMPKWLGYSLIGLAVVLGAFTMLHEPKPFHPQSARPAQAAVSETETSSAAGTEPATRPFAKGFPRDATMKRDVSVILENGIVGLRKGEAVQLIEKTDSGYNAVFNDYLIPVEAGDVKDAPAPLLPP